jgi:hypothetical protein
VRIAPAALAPSVLVMSLAIAMAAAPSPAIARGGHGHGFGHSFGRQAHHVRNKKCRHDVCTAPHLRTAIDVAIDVRSMAS